MFARVRHDVPGTSPPITRWQFPFVLAYALTVHKAQGQTAPIAYDGRGQFASGGGYTALSRSPDLASLHFIHFGEEEGYFLEKSMKLLWEWIERHDLNSGWNERDKRSRMPEVTHVPQRLRKNYRQGDQFEEEGFDPEDPDLEPIVVTPVYESAGIPGILQQIRSIPINPIEAILTADDDQRDEYLRRAQLVRKVEEISLGRL
jgi:hypothetical protein